MPMLSYKFGPARCENVLDPLAIWSISESEKKSFRSTENIDRGAKLTSGLATNMREDAKSRKGSGEGSSNAICHDEIERRDPSRTKPEQDRSADQEANEDSCGHFEHGSWELWYCARRLKVLRKSVARGWWHHAAS